MQNVKSLAQCDGGNAIKDFFHPAHFFGSALVLVVSTLLFYILSVHKSIVSGEYCNGFLVLLQEESRCFKIHLSNNDGQHGALYIQLHLLQTLLQVGDIYMTLARVSL